jgi:hypothetical protein
VIEGHQVGCLANGFPGLSRCLVAMAWLVANSNAVSGRSRKSVTIGYGTVLRALQCYSKSRSLCRYLQHGRYFKAMKHSRQDGLDLENRKESPSGPWRGGKGPSDGAACGGGGVNSRSGDLN